MTFYIFPHSQYLDYAQITSIALFKTYFLSSRIRDTDA